MSGLDGRETDLSLHRLDGRGYFVARGYVVAGRRSQEDCRVSDFYEDRADALVAYWDLRREEGTA